VGKPDITKKCFACSPATMNSLLVDWCSLDIFKQKLKMFLFRTICAFAEEEEEKISHRH